MVCSRILVFVTIFSLVSCIRHNIRRQRYQKLQQSPVISYYTKPNRNITINIIVHIDKALTQKLKTQYGPKTRRKLKFLTKQIISETENIIQNLNENRRIVFKLIDTKFLKNISNIVTMDENASNYLKSYCNWQAKRKDAHSRQFYSVLLTGLDLFYVKNGKAVRRSTGRSYRNGMCSVGYSCAIVQYHPKNVGFLLAHELAHSLGINHDGVHNKCKPSGYMMSSKYSGKNHPKTWSACSQRSFNEYLQSDRASCLR